MDEDISRVVNGVHYVPVVVEHHPDSTAAIPGGDKPKLEFIVNIGVKQDGIKYRDYR